MLVLDESAGVAVVVEPPGDGTFVVVGPPGDGVVWGEGVVFGLGVGVAVELLDDRLFVETTGALES